MNKRDLVNLVKEVIQEISATGTQATSMPGSGEQTATPIRVGKSKALKTSNKLGFKTVNKKKKPYSTKLFDYLQ